MKKRNVLMMIFKEKFDLKNEVDHKVLMQHDFGQ